MLLTSLLSTRQPEWPFKKGSQITLLETLPSTPFLFQGRAKSRRPQTQSHGHCLLPPRPQLLAPSRLSLPQPLASCGSSETRALTSLGALGLLRPLWDTLLPATCMANALRSCSNVSFSRGQPLSTLLKTAALRLLHVLYLVYSAPFPHSIAHLPHSTKSTYSYV